VSNVSPAALDEVRGQPPPVLFVGPAAQVVRELGELGIEQRQQGAERRLLAAVRRGRDQEHVPVRVGGEPRDELVPLVLGTAALTGPGAGVGLVHDHQLGAVAEEVVPAAVGLDEVGRDDD